MAKKKTHLQKLAGTGPVLFEATWLEQYAALCFRRPPEVASLQVLLITARGSGRWVIPKGSPMKGKTPREVAAQEAFEEAGIKGKAGKTPIGRYSYIKRLEDGRGVPCVVDVFALEVTAIAESFKERGQRQTLWVAPNQAGRFVEEPELRGLFLKLEAEFSRQ